MVSNNYHNSYGIQSVYRQVYLISIRNHSCYTNIQRTASLRPGVETLRTALHVSRSTLYEWSQGRNCSSERAEIIQGAKSIIDSFLEQAMLSGKVNPATGIFYCKNWLGYHDSISLEESLPMTSTQEALRAEDLPKLGAEE